MSHEAMLDVQQNLLKVSRVAKKRRTRSLNVNPVRSALYRNRYLSQISSNFGKIPPLRESIRDFVVLKVLRN